MIDFEKKLQVSEYNNKELRKEYNKLNEKHEELQRYYNELNDRYVDKLNAYNSTVVKMREVMKENDRLKEENKNVNIDFFILTILLFINLLFIFLG